MLNLNYVFCFSCFRESIITKFTKTLHQKTVSFSHFLNPGSKLYSNLKYISSFFCEFFFTAMRKILEISFKTTTCYPYKPHFHRYRSIRFKRSTNSGEPAAVFGFNLQIMSGILLLPNSAAAGLLFCDLQLEHLMMLIVGTHLVFVRMKYENTYDIIFLFLLITALKFDRFPNSGEPAAVVDLLSQSVACESALPKSAAAGLLFSNEPSPHYPNPPTPHLHEPIHTPKTSINISIANYKIRRTPHVRS